MLCLKENNIRFTVHHHDPKSVFQIAIKDSHATILYKGNDFVYKDKKVKEYTYFYSLYNLNSIEDIKGLLERDRISISENVVKYKACYERLGDGFITNDKNLKYNLYSADEMDVSMIKLPELNRILDINEIKKAHSYWLFDSNKDKGYGCANKVNGFGYYLLRNEKIIFFKHNLKKGIFKKIRTKIIDKIYFTMNTDWNLYYEVRYVLSNNLVDGRFVRKLKAELGCGCYCVSMKNWFEDLKFIKYLGCNE